MNGTLAPLGLGVVFASLALPALAWTQRRNRLADPQSRQGPLVFVLAAAVALLLVPLALSGRAPAAEASPRAASAAWSTVTAATLPGPVESLSFFGIVGAAWAVLLAFAAARLVAHAILLSGVARWAPDAPGELVERVKALAAELSIEPPRVVKTDLAAVPLVIPGLPPTIVVPPYVLEKMPGAAVDLALRHELTHLARGDHRTSAAVALLKLPFAWHPSARWIERELAMAREEAVDERVARHDGEGYARLLVDVAELRPRRTALSPVAMSSTALSYRVVALLERKVRPLARLGPALGLAGLLALGALALPPAAPAMAPAAGATETEEALALKVGAMKAIKIPGLARIAVGDQEIADIKAAGNDEVVVTGRSPGKTTIIAWRKSGARKSYLVTVTK